MVGRGGVMNKIKYIVDGRSEDFLNLFKSYCEFIGSYFYYVYNNKMIVIRDNDILNYILFYILFFLML